MSYLWSIGLLTTYYELIYILILKFLSLEKSAAITSVDRHFKINDEAILSTNLVNMRLGGSVDCISFVRCEHFLYSFTLTMLTAKYIHRNSLLTWFM